MPPATTDIRDSDRKRAADAPPPRLAISRTISAFLLAYAQNSGGKRTNKGPRHRALAKSDADAHISLAEHFRLMRELTEASEDETLHLSKRLLAPGTTDFVIDTLQQSIDIEDAMKRTARAYNLAHGGYYNRVGRRGDRIVYAINDQGFPYSFDGGAAAFSLIEGLLIFLHALLVLAVGRPLTKHLICVRTRRPRRNEGDGFLDFWPAPVRCGARNYALEYDLAALDLPVSRRRAGPPNVAAVYDVIDMLIAEREQSGVNKPFQTRVFEAIAEGTDDQGEVARALGVSVATLRRRLATSGVTFRQLRSKALNEAARRMLAQGRPVGEIADALGFVDIRSFSRAFKGWNGVTPVMFAQRQASPHMRARRKK
jgi:AraC-like DNA-binding protein